MATTPPPKPSRSSLQPPRLEELPALLATPGWEPKAALGSLLIALNKGLPQPELFELLHAAALRDGQLPRLKAAFDELQHDRRLKALAAERQAELGLEASRCCVALGDLDAALAHAERARAAAPTHPATLARLAALYDERGDVASRARLELELASLLEGSERQRALERALAQLLLLQDDAAAVPILLKLAELAPAHAGVLRALEQRLTRSGKLRELGRALERALTQEPADALALHQRLVQLYARELAEPQRAMPHVEAVLSAAPSDEDALHAAERLLEHRPMALRAAAALSEAYEKLGRVGNAVAMLNLELRQVRGARRSVVQRRLAFLRQDALDDPEGALELLGPVVSGDPADEEARRRYVELSCAGGHAAEAARLLTRIIAGVSDPALKTKLGAELGRCHLSAGDSRQAQRALQQVLDRGGDAEIVLRVAEQLVELHSVAGDTGRLGEALEQVVRLQPEPAQRHSAARRLARWSDEAGDAARAVTAWSALVESPWADEALRRLAALHEQQGEIGPWIEVLQRQAQRANDPGEARQLREQAAVLASERLADRPRAIAAWQELWALHGATPTLLERLVPLLEAERRWEELVRALLAQSEATAPAHRAPLLARVAQLQWARLQDASAALSSVRRALELEPSEAQARAVAAQLLVEGDRRLGAAELLEPLHRREGSVASLLGVLEVFGQLRVEPTARLAALQEGAELAAGAGELRQLLAFASAALMLVAEHLPGRLLEQLASFEELTAPLAAAERARALARVLEGRAIESAAWGAVAEAAAEASAAAGEPAAAVELLRRALSLEPDSERLLSRIEELLALQGTPREREVLYAQALSRAPSPRRQRELLHALATLRQRELGELEDARLTWERALALDPKDWTARDALTELHLAVGSTDAAVEQLEQVLELADGERRGRARRQLAEVEASRQRPEAALHHYEALLVAGQSDEAALEAMVALAATEGAELPQRRALRALLELRLPVERQRETWLRLARSLGRPPEEPAEAERAWRELIERCEPGHEEQLALALRELLRLMPGDAEAAERLFLLGWPHVPAPEARARFERLMQADASRAARVLVELDGSGAAEGEQASGWLELARWLLDADLLDERQGRRLARATARRLAVLPTGPEEAFLAYQRLLGSSAEDAEEVLAELGQLLERHPTALEQRRWWFEGMARRPETRAEMLQRWARWEEQEAARPALALEVFERLAAEEPSVEVWLELARLAGGLGRVDLALSALAHLEEEGAESERNEVTLRRARLLLEHGRGEEAFEELRRRLELQPGDPEVLALASQALREGRWRAPALELIEQLTAAELEPERELELLTTLLTLGPEPELAPARAHWFRRALELREGDAESCLTLALQAAEETPLDERLWESAENAVRRLARPAPLAEAYARLLASGVDAAVAEIVGRRSVEFYEEWLDEPERVLGLLARIVRLAPRAEWAFDRLKLAYNGAGRWDELFELYDGVLEQEGATERGVAILREAAMAAKDFADDPARALVYLERLERLCPADARVEQALERLYERLGRTQPLLDLLSRRLDAVPEAERQGLQLRIATLHLEAGDVQAAFERARELLSAPHALPETMELLERLVVAPAARDSIPPGGDGASRRARASTVRELCAERLIAYYEELGQVEEVARLLEVRVEAADELEPRLAALRQIADYRLERLEDPEGALDALERLVRLAPERREHRERLARLAARRHAQPRLAALLEELARGLAGSPLQAELMAEAGELLAGLGQQERASGLLERVATEAQDRALALASARRLVLLLEVGGDKGRHCAALEQVAELEERPEARGEALASAAKLALEGLSDPERAARAWRRRLEETPSDLVAHDGLCRALTCAERWSQLTAALAARAEHQGEEEAARADRVEIARLEEQRLGALPAAIAAWREVQRLHGLREEGWEALARLLLQTERYVELAALCADAQREATSPTLRAAWGRRSGDVLWRRLGRPLEAVDAFAAVEDWDGAMEVAGGATLSAPEAVEVGRRLLRLASEAWSRGSSEGAARATAWALEELQTRLGEQGQLEELLELSLYGAELPFDAEVRRALRLSAASLAAERLGRPEQAIALLRGLLGEPFDDAVAREAVGRLVGLLEAAGQHADVVTLWEHQAEARHRVGEDAKAMALYLRAATLAEERLGELDRALAGYGLAAALGSEPGHTALARLHHARGQIEQALESLEWLFERAPRERLGPLALELAEGWLSLGRPETARERLEVAVRRGVDTGAVRRRLAEMYREASAHGPLAALLVLEAERASDASSRLPHLREAARLHLEELEDAPAAVPLLRQAVELSPEDVALRLTYVRALEQVGELEAAEGALVEQIERYGARRPKERALLHHALAHLGRRRGDLQRALGELEQATRIDPAHPQISYDLAQAALERGQLARAETALRALLLVLRGPSAAGPHRAVALFDLSEIAVRRDDPLRATEFLESAFEAALECEQEAEALERRLRERGRRELLVRAVEARLEAARSPGAVAAALAELVALHAEEHGVVALPASLLERALGVAEQLERAPEDPAAWAALAKAFRGLGELEREAAALEGQRRAWGAEAPNPAQLEALVRLAELRLDVAESSAAGMGWVREALEAGLEPGAAVALLERRREAWRSLPEAERLFEHVVRLAGDEPALLGLLARRLEDAPGDEAALEELLDRGDTLRHELGLERALRRVVEEAGTVGTARGRALELLARWAEERGEPLEAVTLLEQAARARSEEERRAALLDVARRALGALEQPEVAARLFTELLEHEPAERELWEPLVGVLRRLERYPELTALLERTVPLVEDPELRVRLRWEQAELLLSQPSHRAAGKSALQEILMDVPAHALAGERLEALLSEEGDDEARRELLRGRMDAARDAGDSALVVELASRLGALEEHLGHEDAALEAWRTALEWEPATLTALEGVVRLTATADPMVHGDAVEALLRHERGASASALTRRLLELRRRASDAAGLALALELGTQRAPEDVELRERLATLLLEQHDHRGLARLLSLAWHASPGDEALLPPLLTALGHVDDPEFVVERCTELLALGPVAALQLCLAEALGRLERDEEALAALTAAAALGADVHDLRQALLEAATDRAKGDALARHGGELVQHWLARGESQLARQRVEQWSSRAPGSTSLLLLRAMVAEHEQAWDEALTSIARALAAQPGQPELSLQLARLAVLAERPLDAVEALRAALAETPGDARLWQALVEAHEHAGAWQEVALLLVQRARGCSEPSERRALLARAAQLLLGEGGDIARATVLLEELYEQEPSDLEVVAHLARARAYAQRHLEGVELLQQAVDAHAGRRHRGLAVVFQTLSEIQYALGEYPAALSALARATEMDPRQGALTLELARLAQSLGDLETAQRAWRALSMMKLMAEEGGEGATRAAKAEAHYGLAIVARDAGDGRKARLLVNKALADAPAFEAALSLLAELGG